MPRRFRFCELNILRRSVHKRTRDVLSDRSKLTRKEIFEVHKIGKLLVGRPCCDHSQDHRAARKGEPVLERPLIWRTLNLSLRLRP
jgi:hypothetical protein